MIKQFGQLCLVVTLLTTASIFAGCKNGVCSMRRKPAPVVTKKAVVTVVAKKAVKSKNCKNGKNGSCKRAAVVVKTPVQQVAPQAPVVTAQAQPTKIVAWDIHDVFCTSAGKSGAHCSINQDTFQVVKALHAKGVKQIIFSNISKKSFESLLARHPYLAKYFDLSRSLADAQGIFSRKPHGKYSKKLLEKNSGTKPGDIIFFDDKAKNVKDAVKQGMDAHVFTSASQAESILKQKGLL